MSCATKLRSASLCKSLCLHRFGLLEHSTLFFVAGVGNPPQLATHIFHNILSYFIVYSSSLRCSTKYVPSICLSCTLLLKKYTYGGRRILGTTIPAHFIGFANPKLTPMPRCRLRSPQNNLSLMQEHRAKSSPPWSCRIRNLDFKVSHGSLSP